MQHHTDFIPAGRQVKDLQTSILNAPDIRTHARRYVMSVHIVKLYFSPDKNRNDFIMKDVLFLILCWIMITAAGRRTRPYMDGSAIPAKATPVTEEKLPAGCGRCTFQP